MRRIATYDLYIAYPSTAPLAVALIADCCGSISDRTRPARRGWKPAPSGEPFRLLSGELERDAATIEWPSTSTLS